MYTLKGTFFFYLIYMKQSEYKSTWPCSKLGHLGTKFRSLGQIIENHIVYIMSNFFHAQAYYLKVKGPEF